MVGGLAGVVLASRMTSGQPNVAGLQHGLPFGLRPGRGLPERRMARVSGAIVGVLMMGTLQNAMSLLNVPNFYQYVARGAILLVAVLYDQARRVRREAGYSGSLTSKRVSSPGSDSKEIKPPWSSTMCWQIDRPRPVLVLVIFVEKKGVKMSSRISGGMP